MTRVASAEAKQVASIISKLTPMQKAELYSLGRAPDELKADEARRIYNSIVAKKKDPALLEWVDGTTFKMRVFPLEGRQEKRIILSYTQRLSPLYGQMTYRFPAGHTIQGKGGNADGYKPYKQKSDSNKAHRHTPLGTPELDHNSWGRKTALTRQLYRRSGGDFKCLNRRGLRFLAPFRAQC